MIKLVDLIKTTDAMEEDEIFPLPAPRVSRTQGYNGELSENPNYYTASKELCS